MMNLNVVPENGAPGLTDSIQFVPAAGLGRSSLESSRGPANYAAAWLDNTVAGVAGSSSIGQLVVKIPGDAAAGSSYQIEFEHVSASPNGTALFTRSIDPQNLTSSWADGIPDVWRMEHFGSLSAALSATTADPDQDGISNWAEFKAGTNPT